MMEYMVLAVIPLLAFIFFVTGLMPDLQISINKARIERSICRDILMYADMKGSNSNDKQTRDKWRAWAIQTIDDALRGYISDDRLEQILDDLRLT